MRAACAPLAVAGLCLVTAAGVGAASTTPTSKHVFRPFVGGRLSPSLHVVRARRGFCWTGSLADSGRGDAWRCLIGDRIYDPCFSDRSGAATGFVVCALTPWSAKAVKIVLTRKLPLAQRNRSGAPMRRAPWAIKLESGKACTALTGATGTIRGQGVAYGCFGGGYLLGAPRRTVPTWTISYAAGYKARRVTRVAIAEAWW